MSKQQKTACYDRKYLELYLSEKLNESEEDEVRDHLNSCGRCQTDLETVAAAPDVWHYVKGHVDLAETSDPTNDNRIENLVELLAPTDYPEMIGRIGKYEVAGIIGRGSTGIVVKALEPSLNRFVAIKVLSPAYSSNGAARKRFEREGRAIASVTDEHVVPIYAVDEFRGTPYIVMQYIPGVSLLQRIDKSGPLDTCEVARIGLQVAKGLAAAHAQGVVHRDVKPANVLLEETVDRAMVTDFGLARVGDDASMTRSGTIAGTPQYMSPEQAQGKSVDSRSDLFSLGSLMYAACTARPPFRAETLFGVIRKVCDTEPRPIREINPNIADWLEGLINRLLEKSADHRIQSADEVASILSGELSYLQNPTGSKKPSREWWPVNSRPRSRSALGTLMILGVFIGLVAGFGWYLSANRILPVIPPAANSAPQDWEEEKLQDRIAGAKVFWKTNAAGFDTDSQSTFDQRIDKSIPVSAGGLLKIKADFGDVVVVPSEIDDEVQIEVLRRIKASSRKEAKLFAQKFSIDFDHNKKDNEIVVAASLPTDWEQEKTNRYFAKTTVRVVVPQRFHQHVFAGNGTVSIGDVTGNVVVENQNGNAEFGRIDGDVDVQTTAGNVFLKNGVSGKIDVMMIRGNAYVADVVDSSRIRTSGGNVWIGGCQGEVYCQTSGGNVKITDVKSRTRVHASDGNIDVNLANSPVADSKYSATSGNITLRLRDNLNAVLLPTEPEEIESELAQIASFDDELGAWNLNDGGHKILAESSNGTVEYKLMPESETKSLGGSGLGGSGSYGSRKTPTAEAIAKTQGEPRPGAIATIPLDGYQSIDGYTLYLPVSHETAEKKYPIIVYMQGAYGVGGPIDKVNLWGLTRLIRDQQNLDSERNKLLLDQFIVVSPHIQNGQYYDDPEAIQKILTTVTEKYAGDPNRVYATGVSRGGHGAWGLASRMPETFAAIAPFGGSSSHATNLAPFSNISVWIAHNEGDPTVDFATSKSAVEKIEKVCDVDFTRIDVPGENEEDVLANRHILTAPNLPSHDSWTDMYTSPVFYKWLLRQEKSKIK